MKIELVIEAFTAPWCCLACGGPEHLVYVLGMSPSRGCALGMVVLRVAVVTGVHLVTLCNREGEFRFPCLSEFWLLLFLGVAV